MDAQKLDRTVQWTESIPAGSFGTIDQHGKRPVDQEDPGSCCYNYAHDMGIESKDLPDNPTLCLGTGDVSVYEMVSAYCAFANGGTRVRPMMLIQITDKNGNVLKNFTPDAKQVISANRAYEMLHLMRGAVEDPNGTAQRLRTQYKLLEGGNEIAAKTGTTSNYSDAWFMGMTQHLVSGLWVGGDDRPIHFRNIELGQGGRLAMPAWAMYMQKIYSDPTLTQYRPEPFGNLITLRSIVAATTSTLRNGIYHRKLSLKGKKKSYNKLVRPANCWPFCSFQKATFTLYCLFYSTESWYQ